MTDDIDIVSVKEEIAQLLRVRGCPGVPDKSVWTFLREASHDSGSIPEAVKAAIRCEVDSRIAAFTYGEIIELWLQTDIGWNSDESLADYIAEYAARRDVIEQLTGEMPGWARIEVYKQDNPDWRRNIF